MNIRALGAAGAAGVFVLAGVALAGPASAAPKACFEDDVYIQCEPSGDPSLNGNGNGKAVGRPDAGSVGNADSKSPKGQQPDGSDANNGYECDGNRGIAKGNPAHTRCVPDDGGGGGRRCRSP